MTSSDKPVAQDGFLKPRALGSKSRSFIPMTPRSLKTNREHQNDFARQVAEQANPRNPDGEPPQKKFRSNAAPKGTRLASGYVDRARERQTEKEDAGEDKQKRLNALEEMLKLQQIDQATFDALRDEIGIGGDTSTTHLVKGLDFKLLERIRRGDNVDEVPKEDTVDAAPEVDVEDELEKALEKDVAAVDSSEAQEMNNNAEEDQGTIEPAKQTATLSRDELLQRLKQNRKKPDDVDSYPSQAAEPEVKLDQSRFRKLETKPKSGKHKFTETINGRRREVLVITDKEGKTKRKTRWLDPEPELATTKNGTGDNTEAWGGDLPAEVLARQKAAAEEEEAARQRAMDDADEGDIFGDVGDYDPLAGINSDEDEDDSTEPSAQDQSDKMTETKPEPDTETATAVKQLKSTSKPRNYFATSNTDPESKEDKPHAPTHDPTILAALKRAAQIRQQEEAETTDPSDPSKSTPQPPSEDQKRSKALLDKLQKQSGYDDVDIDMGFGGGSRYDDEDEDGGDGKQKLSQWKGLVEDGDGGDGEEEVEKKGGGGAKRKRGGGGKKRKGDKNSFKDVMSVIEGRKKT